MNYTMEDMQEFAEYDLTNNIEKLEYVEHDYKNSELLSKGKLIWTNNPMLDSRYNSVDEYSHWEDNPFYLQELRVL